jgi:hypothetical protein
VRRYLISVLARAENNVFSPDDHDFQGGASSMKLHHCGQCFLRKYAERKPDTAIARLWRWHTGWCPGWKAYQRFLSAPPKVKI